MEKLHGNHISHISRDVHAHHPLDFSSVHSLHVQLLMQIRTFPLKITQLERFRCPLN